MLRDLALIYLALAHSTDASLEQIEVDTIADRLRPWQDSAAAESLTGAVKDALDLYVREDADREVHAAVARIQEACSPERRQTIIEDLIEVAMADDRFLYKESSFIGELAQAWEVHLHTRPEEEDRKWSILNQDGETDAWTPVHDMALVYLTFAHSTDNDLSTHEVAAITEKMSEWLPDAKEVDVLNIVQAAIQVYAQGPDGRVFAESVEALKKFVPEHQRGALLADLRYVAEADGQVLEREHQMIARLAHAWNLSVPQA